MVGWQYQTGRRPTTSGFREPEIAKFMATVSLAILPIAIGKYALSGEYLLSLYYLALCVLIYIDVRAHLKKKRIPINPVLLLLAVHIGVLILVLTHGASSAFWLFPLTVSSFFYCAMPMASVIAAIAGGITAVSSYWVTGDFWFAFRLSVALCTVVVFLRFMLQSIGRMQQDLNEALETDELTGCRNRRAFMKMLQKESSGLGGGILLFIDIDHFKRVNDHYGHVIGDRVLVDVAAGIREKIREQAAIFRMGGEEFAVLLPHQPQELGVLIAERIRKHLATRDMPEGAQITVSIGVEHYRNSAEIYEALKRADDHLYRAKRAGRNMVMTEVPDHSDTPET